MLLLFSWKASYSQTVDNDSATISNINSELIQKIEQLEQEVAFLKNQTLSFDRTLTAVESISNKVITYLTVFITLFAIIIGLVGYIKYQDINRELKKIRKLESRIIEAEGKALRSLWEFPKNPSIKFLWGTRYAYWFFKERTNIRDIIIRIKAVSELLDKVVEEEDVKRVKDFKKEGMEISFEMMQSKNKLIKNEARILYKKLKEKVENPGS